MRHASTKRNSKNKRILTCNVISPMFSYGGDLELRPTELKALMRYMYRAAMLEPDTTKLFEKESDKFGDAEKQASPVRLQMQLNSHLEPYYQRLLLHKPKEWEDYQSGKKKVMKNYPKKCFAPDTRFKLIIRTRNKNTDIHWYENWVKLSLILGGMGKRSRRGRGCVAVDNMPSTKQNLMEWVKTQLNHINSEDDSYQLNNNEIINHSVLLKDLKRPVIEKIRLGKEITDIDKFLTAVDKASHHIKRNFKPKGNFATGFAKGRERFASSIIISVIKVEDKGKAILLPIYTFVKPIHEKYNFEQDKANNERNTFISKMEEGYK
jgi:CRISPR-associated protein Cmr1